MLAMLIQKDSLVLFQGDSITDCNRDRANGSCLGAGYAKLTATQLQASYPERNLRFTNRGISGNRIPDLLARWDEDCIALQPDWVSILIGINDVWRRFDRNDPTTTEDFYQGYRKLLQRTRHETNAKIILMEPFVLHHPADRLAWRDDLDPKIEIVRQLSAEFSTILISLDSLFQDAASKQQASYWAEDGVHPSPAGHALISKAWIDSVSA